MLEETKAIYNEEIKSEAARRFGADPSSLSVLDGFENFVYEFEFKGEPRILRVTHSTHRPIEHIRGEIAWVNALAASGIPAAPALPSVNGDFVEMIPHDASGTCFTAASFQNAPGVILDDHPEEKSKYWNAALFQQWGGVMAQIHNHAQYQAPKLNIQRPQWHEYDVLDLEQFIPGDQRLVLDSAYSHLEKFKGIPKTPGDYGLTHADLTQWNFNVHAGKITVYDFDSSEYGWFIKDLAVSLYYAGVGYDGDERENFNHEFLKHLVLGYRRIRPISDQWLARIPDFLLLLRISLYSFCHQIGDAQNPTEDTKSFLKRTRRIIESGVEPMTIKIE
jgi:Ser/Thr protein kinase RdoA (MazF antagonist)